MNEQDNKPYVILLKEGLAESIIADLTTVAFLVGTVWVNYKFVGNSLFLNGIIVVMLILFGISKTATKMNVFYSKKEVVDYLDQKKG